MATTRNELMTSGEISDQEWTFTSSLTGRFKAIHTAPIARRSRRLEGVSHLSNGPVRLSHREMIFGFSWNWSSPWSPMLPSPALGPSCCWFVKRYHVLLSLVYRNFYSVSVKLPSWADKVLAIIIHYFNLCNRAILAKALQKNGFFLSHDTAGYCITSSVECYSPLQSDRNASWVEILFCLFDSKFPEVKYRSCQYCVCLPVNKTDEKVLMMDEMRW